MMDNRQLVPRWHTSRKFISLNSPTTPISETKTAFVDDFWFKNSVARWTENNNRVNTLDVYVRLLQDDYKNHPLFNIIHKQLLDEFDELPIPVQGLIQPNLKFSDQADNYSTDATHVHLIIHKLKSVVKNSPRDSLSWIDLCFYYSILGEEKKAHRCAEIAKTLTPYNTFIARSYARFLLHSGDSEKAIRYLSDREDLRTNPLILSAYIAISHSHGAANPNIRKAIKLTENWHGNPNEISELAASIGTIELENGATRKGKKLIQFALENPTENVISHVRWLHYKRRINFLDSSNPPSSIEGRMNKLYLNKEFSECRNQLVSMHKFQPYSSAPIIDAGYLSVVALNDSQFVIDMSERRIPKKLMEFGELNNLIVAKLKQNQLEGIDSDLRILAGKIKHDIPQSVATYNATLGMTHIKRGNVSEGEYFYDCAVRLLERNQLHRSLCTAYYFYSTSTEKTSPEKSTILREKASQLAIKYGVLEIEPR